MKTSLNLSLSVLIVAGSLLAGAYEWKVASASQADVATTAKPPPKGHLSHTETAMKAFQEGDYELAVKEWRMAIDASNGKDATCFYNLGRVYLEWVRKDKTLNERKCLQDFVGYMRHAAMLDRNYLEPRKALCDFFWRVGVARVAAKQTGVDWSQFIAEANEVVRIAPDDHHTYYRRGAAYEYRGRRNAYSRAWKRALGDYRKCIKLKSDEIRYWMRWLGLLRWVESRDPNVNVEEGFLEAFKANPKSARLRIYYAGYLRRKERSDEAEEQLRKAIECDKKSPYGHIAMADFLRRSKQYDRALMELDAAAKIDPVLAEIYVQQSTIYRIEKQLDKAVETLKNGAEILEAKSAKVSATQPSIPRARNLAEQTRRLNFLLANAALDFASVITDTKQRTALITTAQQCLGKLAEMPKNSPHRAKVSGRLAMLTGNRTQAIKDLEVAYEAFKLNDLQTPALLITLYDAAGMPGKAEKLLVSLQNAPRLQESVDVTLALARLKIRYRDYEAADNFVDRALRADKGNKAAVQLKAELQVLMGRGASGGVTRFSRSSIRAMLEQADGKWADGQQKEALKIVQDLRRNTPKNLMLAEREINMHLLLGDKDRAKAIFKEMQAAHPDDDNLQFQAALIDKTPAERLKMRLARADEKITDEFLQAMTKARIASRAGNVKMHTEFLATAAKLKPDDPVVMEVQFRSAVHAKDWKTAQAVAEHAQKVNDLRGKLMRAQLAIVREEYPQAIEILVPLRKGNPDSKFILRLLGQCYLTTNKMELAGDVYGVLESNDPGDVGALIGLAIVAQRQGRMADNEEYVMRAHRKSAGRAGAYIHRRYLEIRETQVTGDEIQKIIKGREDIRKKQPNDINNLERLARLYEFRTRDLKRAEELYRDAYEKTGRSMNWARALAIFYARNGESAKGDIVLQAGFRGAKDKNAKVAWLVLHGEFLTMYDREQAFRALKQASGIDQNNPLPYRAMANLLARTGNWRRAADQMRIYVSMRGEDVRGRKTLIQYRLNAGQFAEAEKEIEQLLNKNPTDAQALLLKAVLFMQRGAPAKAVSVATRALEIHPEFAAALSIRARAYLGMAELDLAKKDLESARTLSKSPAIAMDLVGIYTRLGQDDDALLTIQSVVAENKTYERAQRALIAVHLKKKDWRNVEARLKEVRRLFPKQPVYWTMESAMWRERQQSDKAVAALEKAFELGRDKAPIVQEYMLGLFEAKKHDKVLDIAKAYSTDKDKVAWRAWVNAILGRALVIEKQNDEADKLFLKAIEHAREDELRFVVAQISEAYGAEAAIERMLAGVQRRPNNWMIKMLLADLCGVAAFDPESKLTDEQKDKYRRQAIENYVAAKKMIEDYVASRKLTETPGSVARIWTSLGKVYYDMKKHSDAENAYLACLKVESNNQAALNNLAYLYVNDLNEPQKALPYVRKVIKLLPQDPNVLDTYGWVLAKLKKYPKAKQYLQRSIERDPELAACRYHLGWVFEQTADKKQALKHYRLGKELIRDRKNAPVRKQIEDALKRLGAG